MPLPGLCNNNVRCFENKSSAVLRGVDFLLAFGTSHIRKGYNWSGNQTSHIRLHSFQDREIEPTEFRLSSYIMWPTTYMRA